MGTERRMTQNGGSTMRSDQAPHESESHADELRVNAAAMMCFLRFDRWMTAELAKLEQRWGHLATSNSILKSRMPR